RVDRGQQRYRSRGDPGRAGVGSGEPGAERASAARDSRKDGDLVAILHGRLEAMQEADVLALHVDVHEAPQVAVLGDALAQPVEALVQAVEHFADSGCVLDRGLGLTAGDAAKLRRDLDCDRHGRGHSSSRYAWAVAPSSASNASVDGSIS